MNENSTTLVNRLNQILQRKQSNDEIIRVLQDVLKLLPQIWNKNGCSGDITTKDIRIGDCFPKSGEPNKSTTLRGYYIFVEWMIRQIKEGHVFERLLFDFVHDFISLSYVAEFLPATYKNSRQHTTVVSEMFKDVARLYVANRTSFGLTNEILATFGLRQCLENRLKTIVGLGDIQPRAKIKMDEWFRIIKNEESQISFAGKHHCRMADVKKICEWTNASIHGMTSYCCWQVWLAFNTCSFLFTVESDFIYAIQNGVAAEFNNADGHIVSCPAYNAVSFSAKTLSLLRGALEETIQRQVNQDQKERTIVWICPQACIIDGEAIKLTDSFSIVLKPERPNCARECKHR